MESQEKMEQAKMTFMNQVNQSLVELEKNCPVPPAVMDRFKKYILEKASETCEEYSTMTEDEKIQLHDFKSGPGQVGIMYGTTDPKLVKIPYIEKIGNAYIVDPVHIFTTETEDITDHMEDVD